ncbi:uncharacterized protein LOC128677559 [Plodia interpunctella]|uniref:uncharacterized protein LOC128677559 n=1 Tax=Plodia interpunctella TaxID=58824 RepID=UPI0023683F49|nr:uncharacterized protein LOC128677559 [Plodia interpunctella]
MNPINDITDDEFVPFLQSLGVETYKKSFEWMLHDPAFAEVLRWLSTNLDQNNALNAREEYRYIEIEKSGKLLPTSELENCVSSILDEYPGVCLPGDQEGLEDVKLDISIQKDRLDLLKKHHQVVEDLVKQNEQTREQLNLEVTKLHAAVQQSTEDVSSAADECLRFAGDVESITDGVIEVIADTLDVYANCHADKDLSKKFFTFGPFEAYRQSQALFRSHFDLYTSKRFNRKQKNNVTDEDLRSALIEAKSLEGRLSEAALTFVESEAELSGEQAKLALVTNYNNVHPSQIAACTLEAQSALELLEQEETIIDKQIQDAVRSLAEARTTLAVDTTVRAALAIREQIHADLSHLLDMTQQALTLDRILYYALRHELRTLEQVVQFSCQLRHHVMDEAAAVHTRIDSMNNICEEQEACQLKLQTSDPLTETLSSILGVSTNDAITLVKVYAELAANVRELTDSVSEAFVKKEEAVIELGKSSKPLREYVWDGCTKQPNCRDTSAAALSHSLRQEMENVDNKVLEASSLFTSIKNGDKKCMRKLWQWFLTDPNKLVSAMKGVSRGYC